MASRPDPRSRDPKARDESDGWPPLVRPKIERIEVVHELALRAAALLRSRCRPGWRGACTRRIPRTRQSTACSHLRDRHVVQNTEPRAKRKRQAGGGARPIDTQDGTAGVHGPHYPRAHWSGTPPYAHSSTWLRHRAAPVRRLSSQETVLGSACRVLRIAYRDFAAWLHVEAGALRECSFNRVGGVLPRRATNWPDAASEIAGAAKLQRVVSGSPVSSPRQLAFVNARELDRPISCAH